MAQAALVISAGDNMDIAFVFGLLGSVGASVLFFPQVWKAWRTKETKSLSWLTIIIGIFNGSVWTAYGFLRNDPFIYVTNTLLTGALLMLAALKRRYDRKRR